VQNGIDEAMRELRAADPAAGVQGAWAGSPAQGLVRGRLDDLDDGAAEIIAVEPHRRGSRRWLLAAGAAAVVVAVSVGLTQLGGSSAGRPAASGGPNAAGGPTTGPSGPTTGPGFAHGFPHDPQAATRRLLTAVLDTFPTLPHAVLRASAPSPQLTQPGSLPGISNLVDVRRWWTAPGSMAHALRYVRRHLPAGLTAAGSSTSGNVGGVVLSRGLDFSATLPHTLYAQGAEVLMRVVRLAGGVAVRVDVQGEWIPERTAAETIVAPSAVDVTVWAGRVTPAAHRVFGPKEAGVLAKAVNRLPVTVAEATGCPAERGRGPREDDLVFSTPRGQVRVVLSTFCQDVANVSADGTAQPLLAGEDLNATVRAAVGLPAH
jgi:hypothetical protein